MGARVAPAQKLGYRWRKPSMPKWCELSGIHVGDGGLVLPADMFVEIKLSGCYFNDVGEGYIPEIQKETESSVEDIPVSQIILYLSFNGLHSSKFLPEQVKSYLDEGHFFGDNFNVLKVLNKILGTDFGCRIAKPIINNVVNE